MIAYDNNLPASISTGSSQTVSFTVGSGTDRYLVVGILIQGGFSCSGVTYGGVSMTQLTSIVSDGVSVNETVYLFGLANPSSGANNIVATYTGSGTNGVTASSFTGAQIATAVEASNTGTGSASPSSVSVTTITDNDWLVGFARAGTNTTASTNTTIRGPQSNVNMMDSNGVQTPAGSYSLNFTGTGSPFNWASQVIALRAFQPNAIEFDSSSNGSNGSAGFTVSHTVSSPNEILVAGISAGSDSVSTVTYNGVALTQAGKVQISGNGNYGYLYYLVNPATGTNNLVVTSSAASAGVMASYTGVAQTGQPDAYVGIAQPATASTSLTGSITTMANNCWTIIYSGLQRPVTAGTGTTSRGNDGQWNTMLGDSNGPITPAGAHNMSINFSSSVQQGALLLSIAPSSAVTATANPAFLLNMI